MLFWVAFGAISQAVLALTVIAAASKWMFKKYRTSKRNKWFSVVLPSVAMSILANSILSDLPDEAKKELAEALMKAAQEKE